MDFVKSTDFEELRKSVNLAHHNNRLTQEQVSTCITDLRKNEDRVLSLEQELRSMKAYVEELEEYCISLDVAVRKHHLIISGINEAKDESVNLSALRVLQVCFPGLEIVDIDYAYRIGNFSNRDGGRKKRPILVKLVKENHRRETYKNRQALSKSETYSKAFINEDLPQIVNERRADIRAVFLNATEKKQPAKMAGTKIMVNNVTYKHSELNDLPQGLRLVDTKTVQVAGGLAFCSEQAFLSNFYPCVSKINGQTFDCAEKAYQYARAMNLSAPEQARQIYNAKTARACKKQSHDLTSTDKWDNEKGGIMKLIIQEKFAQNPDLKDKLLATGTNRLIEATQDNYWGAGATIGSKLLNTGKWSGRNELGRILGEVREDLRRTEAWISNRSETVDSSASNPEPVNHAAAAIRQRQLLSFVPPEQADQIQQILSQRSGTSQPRAQGKGKNKRSKNKKKSNKANGPQAGDGNIPSNAALANTQSSTNTGVTRTVDTSGRQVSNQRPPPHSDPNLAANQNLAIPQNLQQTFGAGGPLTHQTGMNFPTNINPVLHQFWNQLAQQMPFTGLYQSFPMAGQNPNTPATGYSSGYPGAFSFPPPPSNPQPSMSLPGNANSVPTSTQPFNTPGVNVNQNAVTSGKSVDNMSHNESMITDQQERDDLISQDSASNHGSKCEQVGQGLLDETIPCGQPAVINTVEQTPSKLEEDLSVHIGTQVF